MTIAVDLGLLALGNADAAPSPAGDGAAAGTVAELADLFQSLVDDLAAAASVASTAAADASPVRPTKSRAPATAGADAGSVGSTKTAEAEDQSAALVALLGMSPLPVPIDLAVASEPCTTSKDAAIDPQAPAVAADGTEAQPSQVAESDEAVLDAPAAAPAAAEDPAGTILAATGAPSGQEQLPQATAAAIVQEAATSATPVTTPPVSDKPEPPSAEEPSVAGRTDAASGWVRPSAAGKALARALSALAVDAPAQKPARAVSNTASPAAVTNQQSAAPAMTESLAASLPAATAEAAPLTKATAAAQPDTYSFATAPRPAESQSAQPLPVEDANRPAVAADVANRAVQAAAPAAKAAVDIDVDANIIKARQSSLAFQVPVRSDGVQVQAAQGGQQASIGLAAPVVMADAGEAGTVTDQIVKAIKIQVRDGIGEVRLRLQPEQMGEVHIALKVDRDRVSAVLQVERPELRAQIEGQGQTLRAGLAAQGLKLEDLTVRPMLSDDTQGRDGNQRGSAKDTPQRRRRQSTAKQFELDDQ